MLRKASRRAQKDQEPMQDSRSAASSFGLPGLLVGIAKGAAESDSARSPTSPLDYRLLSAFGSHFARSPRSPCGTVAALKSWECDRRVGLGLVNSLSDGGESCRRALLGSSQNRSILLGSQSRINIPSARSRVDRFLADSSATSPKSLPKNYVISPHTRIASPEFKSASCERGTAPPGARLELRDLAKTHSCCSSHVGAKDLHSERKNARPASPPLVEGNKFEASSGSLPNAGRFTASLSASDIEQSEDYTCIISRGPNPKTTRIFGNCILESCSGDVPGKQGREEDRGCLWMVQCLEDTMMSLPEKDFLRVCFSCKKKLDGKDIFMYRGEKAFCSLGCRSQEMLVEEELEECATSSSASARRTSCYDKIFLPGVAVAT